jgi:hypothetical protein
MGLEGIVSKRVGSRYRSGTSRGWLKSKNPAFMREWGQQKVPRRIGSHSLGEFPSAVVRIEYERCGRAGSYRLDGLLARFGVDIPLPDLLVAMASCERSEGLLTAVRRAVHGPDVENRRGPMMADDPNGRMFKPFHWGSFQTK